MTSAPTTDIYSQADVLVASYARAGYTRVSPAILQPAEPFLDLSGEDMRRHMYLVTDSGGREFCLRRTLPSRWRAITSPSSPLLAPPRSRNTGPR